MCQSSCQLGNVSIFGSELLCQAEGIYRHSCNTAANNIIHSAI